MVQTLEDLCLKILVEKVLKYREETGEEDYPSWYHEIEPLRQELIKQYDQRMRWRRLYQRNILYYSFWPGMAIP